MSQKPMFYNLGPPPGSVIRACMVGPDYEGSAQHRYRSDLTAVIDGEHPAVTLDDEGRPNRSVTFKAVPVGTLIGGFVVYVDLGDPMKDVLLEFALAREDGAPMHGMGGDIIVEWDFRGARPVLWDDNLFWNDDATMG